MSRPRPRLVIGVLALSVLPITATAATASGSERPQLASSVAQAAPIAGSTGGGDAYFPSAGNGGYEVAGYTVNLSYTPGTRALAATSIARINVGARALRSFSLDLRGLTVRSVTVNGVRATWKRINNELVITPKTPLKARSSAKVRVAYDGTVKALSDAGSLYGWVPTTDGALVVSEPDGASTWLPSNDTAYDAAIFDVTVTVPKALQVVGNGRLMSRKTTGATTAWRWRTDDPQAPYLATIAIGQYDFISRKGLPKVAILDALDRRMPAEFTAAARSSLSKQASMISFLQTYFGSYPFKYAGGIVSQTYLGYALETQTRPVYAGFIDDATVLHELAHQWVGNSVRLARWKDIWLNEGFATYAEWLWLESRGGPTALQSARDAYDDVSLNWFVNVADPGPDAMFDQAVYERGALVLAMLRKEIGDTKFFTLLKTWTTTNRAKPVTTEAFIVAAEKVAGRSLTSLFSTWLSSSTQPATGP